MPTNEQTTRKIFNRLKPYYDLSWDPINHTLHVGLFYKRTDDLQTAYKQATDFLIAKLVGLRKIDIRSRVLDIGCGNGRTLLDVCARFGSKGVGIDLSDAQIKQAKENLKELNRERKKDGLGPVSCTFIRGSAGQLNKLVGHRTFTHIFSQDAILLITDKKSLFKNLSKVLVKKGALAIADFLSEEEKSRFTKEQKEKVFSFVNWQKGFSFEGYKQVLQFSGFKIIEAHKRSKDMLRTYRLLVKQMQHFVGQGKTYRDLRERYRSIVASVQAKKMGWALFFAVKK